MKVLGYVLFDHLKGLIAVEGRVTNLFGIQDETRIF
jgi:hypothetical protein